MTCIRLAVTSGEPAGIGPDLCLQLMQSPPPDVELVVLGSGRLFEKRALRLGFNWQPIRYQPTHPPKPGNAVFCDLDTQLHTKATYWDDRPGILQSETVPLVFLQLDYAISGCLSGEFDALVTCPVQKSILTNDQQSFTGHTEYLQQQTGSAQVVMLLASEPHPHQKKGLNVALVTTHLPLREVPDAITKEKIISITQVLNRGLISDFGIKTPHIQVLGLNPHAGEDGQLGSEELDIIRPALTELQQSNVNCSGPLPADTAFTPESYQQGDAVLAMYHDQGLTVLKHQGFGRSANITLGLPFVRTSVDHGTALDLAGSGQARDDGLRTAIRFAQSICENRSTASTSP